MRLRSYLALAAAVSMGHVSAQVSPQVPPPAALPPQFEVEIIVFANLSFDPTEERFEEPPSDFGLDPLAPFEAPVFDTTTTPAAPGTPLAAPDPIVDPLAAEAAAAAAEALRIRLLPPDQLKLVNEYRKLRNLAAYEPLLHTGWIQPGLPEVDAEPFDLSTLGVLNPHGTVRVHLARFLHITLDLTYQGALGADAAVSGDGLGELGVAPRYRLTTTRSARSGELHYFDHPAFGVLVRVTPVPPADTTTSGRPAA
jgi:hypothetical protein